VAWQAVANHLWHLLGLRRSIDSPDRRLLEETILPYYARQPGCMRVLFVGCDWYTKHYASIFGAQEYWTIDPKPRKKRYGARLHVIDALENLDSWFKPEYFDLIVCNGVFGWGMNGREQCERALAHCTSRLRPQGHFVFGWNEVAARLPFEPLSLEGFRALAPVTFPPLGAHRWLTDTARRHTYAFFSKPGREGFALA
jgi:SAM-dependent methyltransferase